MVVGPLGRSDQRCRLGFLADQLCHDLLPGDTTSRCRGDELGNCHFRLCDCGRQSELCSGGEEEVRGARDAGEA